MAGKKVLLVIALWYQASHKQSKKTRSFVIFCVSWILPTICAFRCVPILEEYLTVPSRLQSGLLVYTQKQAHTAVETGRALALGARGKQRRFSAGVWRHIQRCSDRSSRTTSVGVLSALGRISRSAKSK